MKEKKLLSLAVTVMLIVFVAYARLKESNTPLNKPKKTNTEKTSAHNKTKSSRNKSTPGTPAARTIVTSSKDICDTRIKNTTDNSHLLLGNPSDAQPCMALVNNYLIDRSYYVASYSSQRGTPNWVSWHLDANDLGKTYRTDNFREDPELPTSFYHVEGTDYISSGFDRGHNCPSGDRTNNTNANESTFLMSNMIPQAPRNNKRAWAGFEEYTRNTLVSKGNECFIIMGNYGKGGTGSKGKVTTIDQGKITVPARIWKIVVVIPEGNNDLQRLSSEDVTVVAIDTPNNDKTIDNSWRKYITSVKAIEDSTGYHLLSNLPAKVQTALKSKIYKP
jgi:endonuclease G